VRGFTRTIDCQRGVHANYRQYRNPRLERPQYDGIKAETRCHPLDPHVIYVWVEKEWHPMFEVVTEPDANASDFSSQASIEERRILYGKTLISQKEANTAVAGIIIDMEKKAAQREVRRTKAASQGRGMTSQQRRPAKAGKSDATSITGQTESLSESLKRLRQEGYRGERYK
jgi:hypothetical protein